ncbi:hypothetical protein Cgig2_032021 [Carnegiea gigantea]|uniref:Cation/H+ exchanger transmembrane domain-containing protein n=1 Tax=Carnegiea gigantea TaxID=171969 RepID=A0A9Q1K4U7_9CARY|nr:hypothetical protein Cgig2_032021 [Carnegiea gigantea]
MNESITALLIGLATGVIILLVSGGKSSHLWCSVKIFSSYTFFAHHIQCWVDQSTTVVRISLYEGLKEPKKAPGFQVKKKQFFRNFMTIMMYGAVGTLYLLQSYHSTKFSIPSDRLILAAGAMEIFKSWDIGSLDISDYLAIGAIFAATDSVCTLQVLNQDETPLLYSLVFGEGVVNDATSVVLFNAIQSFDLSRLDHTIALKFFGNFLYLFFASTLLGVMTGLLSAYIIKKLYFGRENPKIPQPQIMLLHVHLYIDSEAPVLKVHGYAFGHDHQNG